MALWARDFCNSTLGTFPGALTWYTARLPGSTSTYTWLTSPAAVSTSVMISTAPPPEGKRLSPPEASLKKIQAPSGLHRGRPPRGLARPVTVRDTPPWSGTMRIADPLAPAVKATS